MNSCQLLNNTFYYVNLFQANLKSGTENEGTKWRPQDAVKKKVFKENSTMQMAHH